MYIGSDAVAKAYIGSDLVYEKASTPVVLPYDAEVEYIQTNGTQYIDTGIVLTVLNFEITLVLQWSGSNSSLFESFFAFMVNGGTTPRCGFHKYQGKWMNGTNVTTSSNVSVNNSKHTFFITSVSTNSTSAKEKLDIDGVNKSNAYTSNTGLPANSMPLFIGARNRGSSVDNPCYAKFYSLNFKTFTSSEHSTISNEWNFIPVRVGRVGYMYETVRGQLYGNIGSGSFTLGNDK